MPLRLAAPFLVVLAAVLAAGCGSSSDQAPIGAGARSCDSYATDAESLRATGIPCDQARRVMFGWQRQRSCSVPASASRGGCLTRSYHCQAARTDRGLAVSCSRKGQSIAFVAKRG